MPGEPRRSCRRQNAQSSVSGSRQRWRAAHFRLWAAPAVAVSHCPEPVPGAWSPGTLAVLPLEALPPGEYLVESEKPDRLGRTIGIVYESANGLSEAAAMADTETLDGDHCLVGIEHICRHGTIVPSVGGQLLLSPQIS